MAYWQMFRGNSRDKPDGYTFIENNALSRKTVTLADSTRVVLNVNSRVGVHKDFDQQDRQVLLDGDAYFEITPDQGKPFSIHTGMLLVRVLGTSFRIQAHHDSPGQSLELLSGQLRVFKDYPSQFAEPEQLQPGEMIMINKDIDLMEKETYDTAGLQSWLKGTLVFNDLSFTETLRQVEEWYGVDIETKGNANVTNFSGTFEQAPLSQVLDSLAAKEKFRYRIKDAHVTLSF